LGACLPPRPRVSRAQRCPQHLSRCLLHPVRTFTNGVTAYWDAQRHTSHRLHGTAHDPLFSAPHEHGGRTARPRISWATALGRGRSRQFTVRRCTRGPPVRTKESPAGRWAPAEVEHSEYRQNHLDCGTKGLQRGRLGGPNRAPPTRASKAKCCSATPQGGRASICMRSTSRRQAHPTT